MVAEQQCKEDEKVRSKMSSSCLCGTNSVQPPLREIFPSSSHEPTTSPHPLTSSFKRRLIHGQPSFLALSSFIHALMLCQCSVIFVLRHHSATFSASRPAVRPSGDAAGPPSLETLMAGLEHQCQPICSLEIAEALRLCG